MTASTRPSSGSRGGRREALAMMGLGLEYVRAHGNRLWWGPSGERGVWDFLGGYGSTFFGHNHPVLVEAATQFLHRDGVIHGQASARTEARQLRTLLTDRLLRDLGVRFEVVLGSTGAEAVEIAARHAELQHTNHRRRILESVDPPPDSGLPWSDGARATLTDLGIEPGPEAASRVAEHNRRALAAPVMHLALEGGFHGMTARALSLTEDPIGWLGERTSGLPVHRIGPTDARGVDRAMDQLTRTLLRIRRQGEEWALEEIAWHPIASLFLEPLQGEGGIHPLSPEVAHAWKSSCDRYGIPVVADEIQSGMGRTGTFTYSEQLGLCPDYLILGKSLGGGIGKVSAVCIREDLFQPGFRLRYASTFSDDGLSSAVAAAALELLDRERAMELARNRGAQILERLTELAQRFPSVIAAVRGVGLMIGIELRAIHFGRSNALSFLSEQGWLGYALSGYLLRGHGLRVAPTLSCSGTIRIEPGYTIPDEAIDALINGLTDLCETLALEDAGRIVGKCLDLSVSPNGRKQRPQRVLCPPTVEAHVGFVGHFIDPADIALWDQSLDQLDLSGRKRFLDRVYPFAEPALVQRDYVTSGTGSRAAVSFIGLPISSDRFHAALRSPERRVLRDIVQRAVDMAEAEGCSVVGLGGYCSIITRNGRDLWRDGPALTTGNAYTVAVGLEALCQAATQVGIRLKSAHAAVVGASGNIGSLFAELLLDQVARLTLVGRKSRLAALETQAGFLIGQILREGAETPIGQALEPSRRRLVGPEAGQDSGLGQDPRACYLEAREMLGSRCPIRVAGPEGLRDEARVIVAASSSPVAVIRPEHLPGGPVLINDLAVPSDVDPRVLDDPDVRVIRGGTVRTPRDPDWTVPGIPLEPGEMYACMTETVLMGLDGVQEHGTIGSVTRARVRETLEMARRHGFGSVRPTEARSY